MLAAVRLSWRLLQLGMHLLLGVVICALAIGWMPRPKREWLIRSWSRRLLHIVGVRVRYTITTGVSTATSIASNNISSMPIRGVVAANHLSWLDVFVVNTLQPCRFVAKAEIRHWPVLGYLCRKTQTIFISRRSTRDLRHTFQQLAHAIECDEPVAFFPEGTTAAQGTLLPFHGNLFEAAVTARACIQPLALRYLNQTGNFHAEIDYTGTITFGQSLMRVLRSKVIDAELIILPPIPSQGSDRRQLAQIAQRNIASALSHSPLDDGT